jgi:hypothetical protein
VTRSPLRIWPALLACTIAACGSSPKPKTTYVDSYLDVVILPDNSCDQTLAMCVSAFEVRLSHEGELVVDACIDVVAAIGQPAQYFSDLASLAGTQVAQELPASGLIGIVLLGHRNECPSKTTPVEFAGFAEVELESVDQQILVPVSCAQPQEPCVTSEPCTGTQ